MRKATVSLLAAAALLIGQKSHSQNEQLFEQIGFLLDDMLWYSDQFMTPATDGAVYQASSGWVATPKKAELWDVRLSFHVNTFFVPKANRRFQIDNSDFQFFTIEGATSASVPTALGNDDQLFLVGTLENGETQNEVRLATPEGVDMEQIVYPYLQGSLGLPYGTELLAKFSTKVKLKKGYYQVYGFGLKHNLSQYAPALESKHYFLSIMAGYSNEEISFNFVDTQTPLGTLGLNELAGIVNTWQFQLNASKEWGRFELMGGIIANFSNISYKANGAAGTVEEVLPVRMIINTKLEEISRDKSNVIGEIAGRYRFGNFFIQPMIAFGKFANTNFSVQYEF